MRRFPLPALLALLPAMAQAQAQAQGCTSFVASVCADPGAGAGVSPRVIRIAPRVPPFAVGDTFPLAGASPLMDPARYALPPAADGWRYYRLRPWVFRVDTATGRVLEVVTGGNRGMLR